MANLGADGKEVALGPNYAKVKERGMAEAMTPLEIQKAARHLAEAKTFQLQGRIDAAIKRIDGIVVALQRGNGSIDLYEPHMREIAALLRGEKP